MTGTIRHRNATVWDLTFDDRTDDSLGVTANHPLYSETRHAWIPAGDLQLDEVVRTLNGESILTARTQRPTRETVFNLEVHRSHSYHVSAIGVLAHNTGLPCQMHHYATNKSSTYTAGMRNIADRYGLDLNDVWNKELLPHLGRHPNKYHDFVLDGMERAAREAGGNKERFLELFETYVKGPVRQNPDLLRKIGWE